MNEIVYSTTSHIKRSEGVCVAKVFVQRIVCTLIAKISLLLVRWGTSRRRHCTWQQRIQQQGSTTTPTTFLSPNYRRNCLLFVLWNSLLSLRRNCLKTRSPVWPGNTSLRAGQRNGFTGGVTWNRQGEAEISTKFPHQILLLLLLLLKKSQGGPGNTRARRRNFLELSSEIWCKKSQIFGSKNHDFLKKVPGNFSRFQILLLLLLVEKVSRWAG